MKTLSFFLNTADKRTLGGALMVDEKTADLLLAQTVELRIDDASITLPRVQFDTLIATVYESEKQ